MSPQINVRALINRVLMSSSSSRAIEYGVPIAVAVAALIGLAVYFALRSTRASTPPPLVSNALANTVVTCGTSAPVVDPATGNVTNSTTLLMPDQVTCGENVEVLSALCLKTRCTAPACAAIPNASWDA